MSNLFLTLVIAFVIIVFAIAFLAIGWLITGKTKVEKACGRDPTKKQDTNCQSCDLCDLPSDEASSKGEKDSSRSSSHDS